MKPEEVKKIRVELELTQEELATILGVTKASVTRYESLSEKSYSPPQGDAEKKLVQLKTFLNNGEDKKLLKKILLLSGLPGLAAILAMGVAAFPVTAAAIGSLTLGAILNIPGISELGKLLTKKGKNDGIRS